MNSITSRSLLYVTCLVFSTRTGDCLSNNVNLYPATVPEFLKKIDPLGISHEPDLVKFYLYNSSRNLNFRVEIRENHESLLANSGWKNGTKTVVIVHGFTHNADSIVPVAIKNAYLKSTLKYNVIVVDWGKLSISHNTIGNAVLPLPYADILVINIPIVAKRLADFIRFLKRNNDVPFNSIHLIGHSLGAHISGKAAFLIKTKTGERIGRITGLDPAGPGFSVIQGQRTLQKSDADFVDVYHTSMGSAGTIGALGDVDFYPNGGIDQPPCSRTKLSFKGLIKVINLHTRITCSHEFAAHIFSATIRKNITACKCKSHLAQLIFSKDCLHNCPDAILAGEPCPISATGKYFFDTSANT